ncbi:hypothetical protein CoNPh11_CDS0019 [Staphylococcus phage S-CoN_Ph11]|nr:hypothetical protein BE22_0066 [Staphylococcus phage vB_SepS_BE22]WNM53077.1 hypothetical protein CoNPh11_CDS0019 [Staphylococcus phage S-CoN_Ph11]
MPYFKRYYIMGIIYPLTYNVSVWLSVWIV